ncbi:MAG TPA: universal stress protein [Candidatus Hydrogenedentes bacterium]|jgi:nucleotide-binding universal stress UspA family protein|nr:universal stress protein [Candidatus Hydrogenedentota bacterium]MDY0032127.1 universal stress protein [FCB group bacterium]NLT61644.1 universal stress protein [Candidatus Hydrogenedentota bacterium]HNZ19511.1 universal stress protein [Candidatus Hydrogenedentota bacterium]HOH34803.1 universal stress protein [Candidatus Hydrogenedentota bacterium]
MTETVRDTGAYERILFCTDFSENAEFAFDYAIDAAVRRPGSVLYVLHVIPEPDAQFWKTYIYEVEDVDQKAKRDIDERIEKTYLVRAPKSVQIEVVIRVGKDSDSILEFAEENAVDLIVMGRRGRSSLGKVLFGNVTEKICRKAPCAVLIVPLSLKERKAKTQE